jgi:hypothetical protein
MRMNRTRSPIGFTLVETLIAIGALLLIALGIAQIFDSTGKTVTVGRRVSAMTEYAALLESRFRDDFAGMTRDGFLIIRNEYANNGAPVPLHADDRTARRRRIDEMLFFKKGQVSSAREAFSPGFPALSNEAAIYFGHGQQRREDFRKNSFYRRPAVNDANFDAPAQLGFQTPGSPNRYASSWNLLRHVTVLAQPEASISRVFSSASPAPPGMTSLPFGLVEQWVIDGEYQIGLRPAAASIFRAIAAIPPSSTKPPVSQGLYVNNDGTPQLSSGIVDIATTDLAEIRQIVTTVQSQPGNIQNQAQLQSLLQQGRMSTMDLMQSWMDDALPAFSMAATPAQRSRMRAEPTAPDFMGVLSQLQGTPSPRASMINAIERANQMAVASSVFVPSCTEFIVEWSFGKVDTNGQIIWHGKERRVDFNGNGSLEPNEQVALPYRSTQRDFMTIPLQIRAARGIVAPNPNNPSSPANPAGVDDWPVSPQLIHGGTLSNPPLQPLTSYFGYYDPNFNPDRRNTAGQPTPDGDYLDAGDALSPTIPWAWPKLIRITLTLADPIDPTFEQSFQFVFDAPGNPVY